MFGDRRYAHGMHTKQLLCLNASDSMSKLNSLRKGWPHMAVDGGARCDGFREADSETRGGHEGDREGGL